MGVCRSAGLMSLRLDCCRSDTSCIWPSVPIGRDKTATVKRIPQANPFSWLHRPHCPRLASPGPVGGHEGDRGTGRSFSFWALGREPAMKQSYGQVPILVVSSLPRVGLPWPRALNIGVTFLDLVVAAADLGYRGVVRPSRRLWSDVTYEQPHGPVHKRGLSLPKAVRSVRVSEKTMSAPNITRFSCPHCGASYHLVHVEAEDTASECEVACLRLPRSTTRS
jgi:hypothetical protein